NDYTLITNAASDDLPLALIFATNNDNPAASAGVNHDHGVGVDFHTPVTQLGPAGISGHWGLYNEDGATFAAGVAFNVMITPAGDRAFLHTSDITNTTNNETLIDHPWL